MKKTLFVALMLLIAMPFITSGQSTKNKRNKKKKSTQVENKITPKKKFGKIKGYDEVISKNAITDDGLFKVHKVEEKYFFEIPKTHLGRHMLLVSRISKLPANLGGGYINAGTKTGERLITWEQFDKKILIKERSYNSVADE